MKIESAAKKIIRNAINQIPSPSNLRRIKPDYEGIARKIVRNSLRIKRGESVLIEGRADNHFFSELIGLECKKVGAHPVILSQSDEYSVRSLTEVPIEVIKAIPRHYRTLVNEADVLIRTFMQGENPFLYQKIPEERAGARREAYKFYLDEIATEKRWLGMCFPTPEQAKFYAVNFNFFHNMFWRAIDIDYRELSQRTERIAQIIEKADRIIISSKKGTDIEIGIGDRRVIKEDGIIDEKDERNKDLFINLPCGEVAVAPMEKEANGRVIFDLVYHNGKRIEDLEIEFVSGKAIPQRAKMGFEVFTKVMANSCGDKDRIGELGIGLNPAVTKAIGYMLTDEKMIGTVHIALGDNRMLGGINNSNLHWDLLIMEPTVVADNEILMEKGELKL